MTVKRSISFLLITVLVTLLAVGCSKDTTTDTKEETDQTTVNTEDKESKQTTESVTPEAEKPAETTVTETPDKTEAQPAAQPEITGELSIKADSNDAVKEDGNKYILSKGGEYRIRGNCGNRMIYIDAKGEELELHLEGVTMTSEIGALIYVENAEEVTISASEGTNNELSDMRPARADKNEETEYGNAAIYSKDDLKFKGRGRLTVNGSYNNGIGCKNDIKIKNITLTVNAQNNGIKGNDSVTIESGNISVTAKNGNGIKTENTHVSDKGNQKGYVTIKGGVLDINSADDPIDAAYDLILDSQNAKVTTNK
ncbi:MAG: carbohydrate-binding domain-containing protein [Lachnospiraceae bacterium]|nr:carbohydrate-binding domain-containing protein [Lachnospiraceae bacterium]